MIISTTDNEQVELNVKLENETVWLTQAQMQVLFDKGKSAISEHIRNIFKEGELAEDSVVRKFRTTGADGKKYEINHYNLDVIISVGYRVKSQKGTQFRIWATQRLKDDSPKNLYTRWKKWHENFVKLEDGWTDADHDAIWNNVRDKSNKTMW